jgi:hypothetical protein
MFEAVQAHWKKPTRDLVVIKAPATAMNPTWWMPARIAQVQALPDGDLIYKTDVLAEFADPSSSLFASVEILRGTRKGPVTLNYVAGGAYSAAMDPATRGNAWTLVVVAHEDRGDGATEFVRVVCARQWQGSRTTPLQPDAVLAEVAGILCDYDLHEVWTDQLASDFVVDIAGRHGLEVQVQATTPANKVEMFESLRARISDGGVELPDDPAMRADLLAIRKIVTRNGVAIDLPRTADGRHCDYAPALALAVSKGGEGTPLWVRAMMAWKARENGEAPPAREAPRAANYFVDPATDRTFGQREKYVPPVVATTDYIRAIVTVVGNPPHYPRDYVATWVRAEHTRFTPNCTKEFREEVERQRSRGTL